MKKMILALGLALMSAFAMAKTDSDFSGIKYNSKGDIVRGEWTSQFSKAMKQGKADGVPVMIFWANNGCGHCAAVEEEMTTSTFTTWQKKYQIYMVLTCGGNSGAVGTEAGEAFTAVDDVSLQNYPFIAIYKDGKKIAFFEGNGMSATDLINAVQSRLKGYSPSIGGWFDVDKSKESAGHRYEAEAGTKTVTLKLVRKSDNVSAGTDSVKVTFGKTSATYTAEWAKNKASTTVAVKVPSGMSDGDKAKVVINGKSDSKYITYIYFVKKANSAANPKWKGESFGFGEWTADIDGAKAKAASATGKAYTLVSIQGSMWCPDCANTDRNFLDVEKDGKNRFQAWAKSKQVALVTMDIPNYNGPTVDDRATPTLFDAEPYKTTLAREKEYPQSGASESLLKAQERSGLGYLSRKGISESEAKTTLKKFHDLAVKSVAEGGYHVYFGEKDARNEDGNAFRPGVPIFVLLRKDGTVAARFTRFAAVSPMKADQANFDNYVKRFEEMLAIADAAASDVDGKEIRNNYPSADCTALQVGGGAAKGRLCNADFRDTFKLTSFGGAAEAKVTISGSSSAKVIAQFIVEQNGKFTAVGAPVTNAINAAQEITGSFAAAGTCYLRVAGADIASSAFKAESATASHFTEFSVTATLGALIPQEKAASVSASGAITFKVVSGQVYRITGLASVSTGLTSLGDDLYEATAATATAVGAGTVTYQKWVPAKIAFKDNEPAGGVGESKGQWTLVVERQGGSSGTVSVKLELDKKNTTFYYDHDSKSLPRFAVDGTWGFESKVLSWADGDAAAKSVIIELEKNGEIAKYFGDGDIAFKLTGLTSARSDATLGKAAYVLKVKDESSKKKSTISLTKADPAWTYSRTVYARKSKGVKITLSRSNDGNPMENRILLSPSVSTVKFSGNDMLVGKSQLWDSNDYADKIVKVSKLPAAGKSVTVTLKSESGTFKADSDKKDVKIISVDDKAPAFTVDKVDTIKMITYSECSKTVKFDPDYIQKGDKLSVELVKGSLPKGIKAKVYQSGKVKFYGIPTAAKSCTAYYRACAKRNGKTVKGLLVKVPFKVVDPTTVDPKDPTYGNLSNTAVKSTRSLDSLMVLMTDEGGATRLVGTVNVTIPKSGKLSGKYVSNAGTVSFEAKGWDAKKLDSENGTLTAVMDGSKKGYTIAVAAFADKSVEVLINDPKFEGKVLRAFSLGTPWESTSSGAKSWKGLYTAALIPGGSKVYLGNGDPSVLSGGVVDPAEGVEFTAPRGYGYVALKMTSSTDYKKGKMTWAGKLPNGQAISGSASLTKGSKELGRSGYAYLPLFKKTGDERFAVVAEIKSGASKSADAGFRCVTGSPDLFESLPLGTWTHKGDGGTGYSMDLHLFGSYYDPERDLTECCKDSGVSSTQTLRIAVPEWAGYDRTRGRGEPELPEPLKIKIGKSKISVTSDSNPNKFKITLDSKTGILSGSLKLDCWFDDGAVKKTVTATWTGIMATGWGSECGCAKDNALTLPFICGAWSFEDKVTSKVEVLSSGCVYTGSKELFDEEHDEE